MLLKYKEHQFCSTFPQQKIMSTVFSQFPLFTAFRCFNLSGSSNSCTHLSGSEFPVRGQAVRRVHEDLGNAHPSFNGLQLESQQVALNSVSIKGLNSSGNYSIYSNNYNNNELIGPLKKVLSLFHLPDWSAMHDCARPLSTAPAWPPAARQ